MIDTLALILGCILYVVVCTLGFLKKLRNDRIIFILINATGLISVYAIFSKNQGLPFVGRVRGSNALFIPFIYVLTYAVLRHFYKQTYNREPTYNRTDWYDSDEGREQNFFDVAVFILPMAFSIFFPLLLNYIWQ